MNVTVKYYRAKSGKWRWQLKRGNEKILDSSSQGFSDRRGATRNFERTRRAMNLANEAVG